METLYNIKKWALIGACFVTQAFLLGVPEFNLPEGTPGLQPGFGTPPGVAAGEYVCVCIPNTKCRLYFPKDGSQPTTQDAGAWSGAKGVVPADNDAVTDWWVRVFGGRQAIGFSRDGGDPYFDPPMGFDEFGNPMHIFQFEQATSDSFRRQFWQTFRTIAADPVGRVLLYRLLIEIRRRDIITHRGCCEQGIANNDKNNEQREKCCSISIFKGDKDEGCSYCFSRIVVGDKVTKPLVLKQCTVGGITSITTVPALRPLDVALFHEMIHWFHYLRNPVKACEEFIYDTSTSAFQYAMRCYYGDQTELKIWDCNINSEDIATILGSPNHSRQEHVDLMTCNTFLLERPIPLNPSNLMPICVTIGSVSQYIPYTERYLNGDDLSENVYRCSRHFPMRWGHTARSIQPVPLGNIPNRFKLAHLVAYCCYREITGVEPTCWRLVPGEAILP